MSNLDDVEINHVSSRPAEDVAAERVRNAVKPSGGRKEGAATYIPEALALSPLVMKEVVKETYGNAMKRYNNND